LRIGFTGTRQGMTERQKIGLRDLLAPYAGAILHHGDAIGADAEAHDIAIELGCAIVIHPPAVETQRAFNTAAEVRAAKPYLVRNKDIVRETALLIAAPAEATEQLRSGTWSTVRYAKRLGRQVCLLTP
jgi:predicted Rossmann fold nucleotide-binding protein DprA/Smf involved in DNA uptake